MLFAVLRTQQFYYKLHTPVHDLQLCYINVITIQTLADTKVRKFLSVKAAGVAQARSINLVKLRLSGLPTTF